MGKTLLGASLFSGAGIGDMGFRAAGIVFVAMCEIEQDRNALARTNFPETQHFAEDINTAQSAFCQAVTSGVAQRKGELFLISCTAPCQGMSKSGQGTLLNNIRKGKRPQLDPRNRLILPALRIICELQPQWVVFENVPEMRNTVIEDDAGKLRLILDIIDEALSPHYSGKAYDIEFADYGIAQRRQRLITVYTRDDTAKELFRKGIDMVPPPTHAKHPKGSMPKWISVVDALKDFPPLDSISAEKATSSMQFHRVPVLDPKKYEWIRHTPPGMSAFDNQCINPQCDCKDNPSHSTNRGDDGINRASKETPLYCAKCGALLPRPYTVEPDGSVRIMSGYTSAYKRMDSSLPAPALTRNLSYPCSDQKVHPYQNRVLSLAEAMTLQTISSYDYKWGPVILMVGNRQVHKKVAPDGLIRLVIGESVPPMFLQLLGEHIINMSKNVVSAPTSSRNRKPSQARMW